MVMFILPNPSPQKRLCWPIWQVASLSGKELNLDRFGREMEGGSAEQWKNRLPQPLLSPALKLMVLNFTLPQYCEFSKESYLFI